MAVEKSVVTTLLFKIGGQQGLKDIQNTNEKDDDDDELQKFIEITEYELDQGAGMHQRRFAITPKRSFPEDNAALFRVGKGVYGVQAPQAGESVYTQD